MTTPINPEVPLTLSWLVFAFLSSSLAGKSFNTSLPTIMSISCSICCMANLESSSFPEVYALFAVASCVLNSWAFTSVTSVTSIVMMNIFFMMKVCVLSKLFFSQKILDAINVNFISGFHHLLLIGEVYAFQHHERSLPKRDAYFITGTISILDNSPVVFHFYLLEFLLAVCALCITGVIEV